LKLFSVEKQVKIKLGFLRIKKQPVDYPTRPPSGGEWSISNLAKKKPPPRLNENPGRARRF